MVDIHNYKIKLERTLAKIKISEISEQNKKDIFDFHNLMLFQAFLNVWS